MKKIIPFLLASLVWLMTYACETETSPQNGSKEPPAQDADLSIRNLIRSMEILDDAVSAHFTGSNMAMARFYNPHTEIRSSEIGSVWMYSSAIEAVNAILHALKTENELGDGKLYDQNFHRYVELLEQLYDNADYYLGTFTLTSYTQTKEWTVYGVNRGSSKGSAEVEGVMNVYDDQMWLVREYLESYKVTGNERYLQIAEYLTEYVLDGWDSTFDSNGNEVGGIPWGPGYVSKHSCSNGPMVSPLVWLHEIYKGKNDEITHRYINSEDRRTRVKDQMNKSDYYLMFAQKVYDWQVDNLLGSHGVYDDMMGGCTPGNPEYETIDGVSYRKGVICTDRVGPPYTYNSGTMVSGAADLYRATGDQKYIREGSDLSDASFSYFANEGANVSGYYTYDIGGFRNWFNGVLLRGYVDFNPAYAKSSDYIKTFQDNLDYGYENFLYKGFLPTNLLVGWSQNNSNNNTEGMFSFTFAAEYAVLSRYNQTK